MSAEVFTSKAKAGTHEGQGASSRLCDYNKMLRLTAEHRTPTWEPDLPVQRAKQD